MGTGSMQGWIQGVGEGALGALQSHNTILHYMLPNIRSHESDQKYDAHAPFIDVHCMHVMSYSRGVVACLLSFTMHTVIHACCHPRCMLLQL